MSKRVGAAALPGAMLVLFMCGCGGLAFDETDDGSTKEVFLGTTFSVSLPALSEERRPVTKGTIIRFLGRRQDESTKGDVFEFEAKGLGQDQIRIPSASGKDYVLTVKIKSASDEPSVPIHHR